MIAGMGGGASLPDAISCRELQSWGELTGNRPTFWEVEALRAMDRSWRAAYDSKHGSGKSAAPAARHQGVGEYCQGKDEAECKKQFGAALPNICATCPN